MFSWLPRGEKLPPAAAVNLQRHQNRRRNRVRTNDPDWFHQSNSVTVQQIALRTRRNKETANWGGGACGQYAATRHQSSPISKDKRVKMLILLPYRYTICLTRRRYSVQRSILPLDCFFPASPSFERGWGGGSVIDDTRRGCWPCGCRASLYFLSSDSGR